MKYEVLYYKFIDKFLKQTIPEGEYTELHHILPRYLGGGDEESNLVRLTYRQHIFVHHLWARATQHDEAWVAYKMMSGATKYGRLLAARLGGQANKKSKWLDEIRPLANTPERQRKLVEMNKRNVEEELWRNYLPLAWEKLRGSKQSRERLAKRSKAGKKLYQECPKNRADIQRMLALSRKAVKDKQEQRIEDMYKRAERNEGWLHKKSPRSKNLFISGEGLVFDSPIYAAKYYNVEGIHYYDIENWCKRNSFGWRRVPKPN